MPAPPPALAPRAARAATPVSWKVHREVVLLAGWGRAILLQLAHPLVARGVADHSPFAREAWGRARRLRRTLGAMLALSFGTPGEAAEAAARINAIHDRVQGRLGAPEGAFPAGACYSAHDPALLGWVHATLLDSFLLTYQRLVAPLEPGEQDRYCEEASGALEPLLGIPAGALPRSRAALDRYLRGMLEDGPIHVTDTARALGREVLAPDVTLPARPAFALLRLVTAGLLPPPIRAAYGLPWDGRRERALRLAAGLVRGTLPLVPPLLRHWPEARAAAARAGGRS